MGDVEKPTVLVVDDMADSLLMIRDLLSGSYNVRAANSGEKAIRIANSDTVLDLILLDIVMPDIDGYEVCKKLKENEKTKNIPIIFLTAKSDVSDETAGLKLGAVDYIIKPISPSILLARVHTHIEMKKMQDLLKEKTVILEETNSSLLKINTQKDRFLGVVAHDLRNPLSVFQGYCDLLITELVDREELNEILNIMHDSTVQMCNLVTDLLDVSQVNLGKFNLNKDYVALAPYVQNIVQNNQLIANRKNIHLLLFPIDEKEFGYFDPNRIRQVLTNLLTNSIKFSYPDTTVTISVERNLDNYLIFKVKDQGQGIKADEVPYVFGEFQKTSTTSTAGEQSTGLGLAICRSIIAAHHGEIKCDSVIDVGSCFYFKIPNN